MDDIVSKPEVERMRSLLERLSPVHRLACWLALSVVLLACGGKQASATGGGPTSDQHASATDGGLTSDQQASATDGGPTPEQEAGAEGILQAGDATDASDGGGISIDGPSCPSVAVYCGSAQPQYGGCVPNWVTAQNASTWCKTEAGASYLGGAADVFMQTGCNGFNTVVLSATDMGIIYFYDMGTGALIGIARQPSWSCVAGVIPPDQTYVYCSSVPRTHPCGP
jgi:hypothetical protein